MIRSILKRNETMCKGIISDVRKDTVLRITVPIFSVVLLNVFFGTDVYATGWSPPVNSTELSENGRFEFRINPSKNWSLQPGNCYGALYEKKHDSWKLCWKRPLINDIRPIRAYVSNSGKYVVTVGEWNHFERLPIVVYAANGSLINVYGELQQLVSNHPFQALPGRASGKDLPWTSKSGRDWLSRSLLFFGPKDRFFIVRLSNGEVLVFETFSGELKDYQLKKFFLGLPRDPKAYGGLIESLKKLLVMRALKLASSDLQEEKDVGLFVLKQYKDCESIGILKEATKDQTFRIVDTPQGKIHEYPIRQAAENALKAIEEMFPEGDDLQNERSVKKCQVKKE